MNFDASFLKGKVAMALVVRDSYSVVVRMAAQPCMCSNAYEAKL